MKKVREPRDMSIYEASDYWDEHDLTEKAVVDIARKEGKEAMRKMDLSKEPCSECGGRLERRYITQEFEREGVKVKLSGLAALVCSECGETYFQPGGADKVAEAANSLLRLAVIEKQHKRSLTAQICRV